MNKKRLGIIILGIVLLMITATAGGIIISAPTAPTKTTLQDYYMYSMRDTNDMMCFKIIEYVGKEPCFFVDDIIDDKDLQAKIAEWKIAQDAADVENWERKNIAIIDNELSARNTKAEQLANQLIGVDRNV